MIRALLVVALLAGPAAAGPCMIHELEPIVHTRTTTKLPSDGAVIVIEHSTRNAKVPKQPTVWRLASGAAKPAARTQLAPGLWRYELPGNAVALENDVWKHAIARAATTQSKLAAPKIKRLAAQTEPRGSFVTLDAELDGNAPPDALAIIVADAKTKKPRSWGYANGPLVRPYSKGKCDQVSTGTVASKRGDDVILYWVDTAGRLSDATGVLRVQ